VNGLGVGDRGILACNDLLADGAYKADDSAEVRLKAINLDGPLEQDGAMHGACRRNRGRH
jgi:hypothetical protein